MELTALSSLISAFGLSLLIGLGIVALYAIALITSSAIEQIPLKTLVRKTPKLSFGLIALVAFGLIMGTIIGSSTTFKTQQLEAIEARYGYELLSAQVERLEWPKKAPTQTTIFGSARLDENLDVTLVWDDGVYRLVNSESLGYKEIEIKEVSQ